jgi:hypothetical protein
MEPTLSYSNPEAEPLPIPPGPPDPPIPPGLLVEPARRKIVRRRMTFRQMRDTVLGYLLILALLIGFPGYSLLELYIFCFVPATAAHFVGLSSSTNANKHEQISYSYYSPDQKVQSDSEPADTHLRAVAKPGYPLKVHALKVGPFYIAKLDTTWFDYLGQRWLRWSFSAALLGLMSWSLIRRRKSVKLEESPAALFAIHGVPMIARIIKTGYGSFTISSRTILYQFILPNGRAIKTKIASERAPSIARRRKGSPIIVICHPTEPQYHLIYDELRFRVEVKEA